MALRANHADQPADEISDDSYMSRAIGRAAQARLVASPNPWVGAVLVCENGVSFEAASEPAGGKHAEAKIIEQATERFGMSAFGGSATLYVTLEPCSHLGKTPPCVEAIIATGIKRVVVAIEDPDNRVAGSGIRALRSAGIECKVGSLRSQVEQQLAPYLKHRRTGRPYVVLKSAITIDGASSAADKSSKWITGEEARHDSHILRASSDAIVVGAGTVREDNPRLTVRGVTGPDGSPLEQPKRIVLGKADADCLVHPCFEFSGSLDELLDRLGGEDILQVLVEGGPTVSASFHDAGLVDRYVAYLAPAIMGGTSISPFSASRSRSIGDVWRGDLLSVARLGSDVRLDFGPS